jgi:hypothetical protein
MKTCSPVDGYERFGEILFFHLQGIIRPQSQRLAASESQSAKQE